MEILVIEPIIRSGTICSLTVFDEDYKFLYQHIVSDKDATDYLAKEYEFVCYDAFKTMDGFGSTFLMLYDVKVLYELKGLKFTNLISLGREVFGVDYMNKYSELSDRVNAHLNSYKVANIDSSKYGYSDLLPTGLVEDLYRERAHIISSLMKYFVVEENKDIKKFYESKMFNNVKALYSIGKTPINIDLLSIKDSDSHYAATVRKNTTDGKARLHFNAVGAKTGRLSFKRGTINIYSLPKSIRKCVVPASDCSIVQFDFKSLHPRLAIFSTKDDEFKNKFKGIDDVYSLFPGDRDENKVAFLAWMYSNARNEMFEREALPIYNLKNHLHIESRRKGRIVNEFGRVIHCGDSERKVVFQNYITSLEVDVILGLVRMINHALRNRRSRILFSFHDAIICEVHKDERALINSIKDYMERSPSAMFGSIFPVEVKEGINFGELNAG